MSIFLKDRIIARGVWLASLAMLPVMALAGGSGGRSVWAPLFHSEQGPVSLAIEASPTPLTLVDDVFIRLHVTAPLTHDVGHVDFEGVSSGLNLIDTFETVSRVPGSHQVFTTHLRLRPGISGPYDLPALRVGLTDRSRWPAHDHTLTAPKLALTVTPPPAAPNGALQDVFKPHRPPPSPWRVGGGLAILAFVGWAVARGWRRRVSARDDAVSPRQWALHALRLLIEDEAGYAANAAMFSQRITAIVREYLEKALQVPASLETSQELLKELAQRQGLPRHSLDLFQSILTQADLAKFASWQASPEDMAKMLTLTEACISSPLGPRDPTPQEGAT